MSKSIKNNQALYFNKELYDLYTAWYKFCNKNFTKPRDEQFYNEFVKYYDQNRKN